MESRRSETVFFVALLALALFLSWMVFQPYVSVLVLAGTLAFLFRPLYHQFLKVVRYESLSGLLVVAVVTIIVFLPLTLFGARIFTEATTLYGTLTGNGGFDLGVAVTRFFHTNLPGIAAPNIALSFNDSVKQMLTWLIQNLGSLFSGVAQIFFTAFLSLFGLFYLLKDGEQFKAWILKFIPLEEQYAEGILHDMEAVATSVIRGTLVMAIIQGVVMGIGFLIFGIPEPAFWGALTVIVSIIPIVGTWLVAVPAVAYLFLTGQTVLGVGLAIWSVVLINLVYNLITPQLMHRDVHIHPYVILLSVLGGLALFGPIGFLLGPLIIAFLVSLLTIYPKVVGK